MLKFKCRIKGIAPLLFNRFPEEDYGEDRPGGKGGKKKAPLTKEKQVERSLYLMDNKTVYQPAEHLVGSMIKAGVAFKLQGAGRKTMKDVMKAGLFVEPLKIPHINQKYITDWRPVIINRGRVMKGRARMDQWELKFEMVCIDDRATAKDVEEILTYAGGYVGIGDYRPRYGRFEVVSMDEVEVKT